MLCEVYFLAFEQYELDRKQAPIPHKWIMLCHVPHVMHDIQGWYGVY